MIQRPTNAAMTRQNQLARLREMGWTEGQITRFGLYRAIYRSSYYQFDSAEYHRLQFVRWLALQGKISG